MKKFILPLVALFMIIGCSEDDYGNGSDSPSNPDTGDTGGDTNTGQAIIRIAEVDASNDEVILSNLGDGTLDIGNYFLCLGPGTYAQVSSLTDASTNLEPNTTVTLTYDMDPAADGLGVFTTNTFDTTDPTILIDYVQWGAANQPRVDQAVIAGRWDNEANFVGDGSPYIFQGTATDFGSTFWEGTEAAGVGVLKILTVDANTDEVTLTNLGESNIDVADYYLCRGPGNPYILISTIASGSTVVAPNGTITLPYDMNPASDGLSIFANNTFSSTDPEVLLDYVQWGAPNQARVGQAVTAGRWDSADNFVANGSPYEFEGTATDFGSTFWSGTATEGVLRILTVDTDTDEVTLTNLGGSDIDVADYFLCRGPGNPYILISTIASGSTIVGPNETITLPYDMNPASDGLSIFANNTFSSTDPEVLLDYVQWGAANQARVGQAVTAGRWDSADNFVTLGSPYNFNGSATDVGVTFW